MLLLSNKCLYLVKLPEVFITEGVLETFVHCCFDNKVPGNNLKDLSFNSHKSSYLPNWLFWAHFYTKAIKEKREVY